MSQTQPPAPGSGSNGPFVSAPGTRQGLVPPRSTRGSAGWWVAAGVAVLVIVVLAVMLLQGSRQPVVVTPTPTPPASESTVTDPEGLGEFAPTYDLRELSTLEFPPTFDGYDLDSEQSSSQVRLANYMKDAELGLFKVIVALAPSEFAYGLEELADPSLIGDAVCGVTSEDGELKECIMAGTDGSISISSAGDTMTLEELARIIQAFYAFP
ncbi:MAG: hypothetical protein Q4P15_02035 [Propionibacteriaceae bacterium]|nr:hypothetical protein [Propionibacteriaceae bacterium]